MLKMKTEKVLLQGQVKKLQRDREDGEKIRELEERVKEVQDDKARAL